MRNAWKTDLQAMGLARPPRSRGCSLAPKHAATGPGSPVCAWVGSRHPCATGSCIRDTEQANATPWCSPCISCTGTAPSGARESVASLRASHGIELRLTVVDNASPHPAGDAGTDNVIRLETNRGFTGAANVALHDWLEHSSAPYCIVAAHDLIVEPDTVRALVDAGHAHPRVGVLGPNFGGTAHTSDGGTTLGHDNGVTLRTWISGACMLLSRECVEDVGNFDEDYGSYFEDIDYCHRAAAHSWQVGSVDAAPARGLGTTGGTSTLGPVNSVVFAYKHGDAAAVRRARIRPRETRALATAPRITPEGLLRLRCGADERLPSAAPSSSGCRSRRRGDSLDAWNSRPGPSITTTGSAGPNSTPSEYGNAQPFPHIVMRGLIDESLLRRAAEEFPSWNHMRVQFDDTTQVKSAENRWTAFGPATREVVAELQSAPFLEFLAALSGIPGLLGDPELVGGGQHQIHPGGMLRVHADFNQHLDRPWARRLNVLVYLNEHWDPTWGGALELWDADMTTPVVKVPPELGTVVVFTTSPNSYHGHPEPLACPADRTSKSLAFYYYTDSPPSQRLDTAWRGRPGEQLPEERRLDRTTYHLKRAIRPWMPRRHRDPSNQLMNGQGASLRTASQLSDRTARPRSGGISSSTDRPP